jgi:hypothetical protein
LTELDHRVELADIRSEIPSGGHACSFVFPSHILAVLFSLIAPLLKCLLSLLHLANINTQIQSHFLVLTARNVSIKSDLKQQLSFLVVLLHLGSQFFNLVFKLLPAFSSISFELISLTLLVLLSSQLFHSSIKSLSVSVLHHFNLIMQDPLLVLIVHLQRHRQLSLNDSISQRSELNYLLPPVSDSSCNQHSLRSDSSYLVLASSDLSISQLVITAQALKLSLTITIQTLHNS